MLNVLTIIFKKEKKLLDTDMQKLPGHNFKQTKQAYIIQFYTLFCLLNIVSW